MPLDNSELSESNMKSLYLGDSDRRETFRIARKRLYNQCGEYTLYGESSSPSDEDKHLLPTKFLPSSNSFWIQDGEFLHPLQIGINTIGRLPENEVVIRDECVSRRHCAIILHHDGRIEIHDVASKNGTIVNGLRIQQPTRLEPGDVISLCSRQLKFLVRDNRRS